MRSLYRNVKQFTKNNGTDRAFSIAETPSCDDMMFKEAEVRSRSMSTRSVVPMRKQDGDGR